MKLFEGGEACVGGLDPIGCLPICCGSSTKHRSAMMCNGYGVQANPTGCEVRIR